MASTCAQYWGALRTWCRAHRAVCWLMLVGGLLRALGIPWGLPWDAAHYNFHPDEWTYTLAAYSFPFHIVFQTFHPYPPMLPYVLNAMSPLHFFGGILLQVGQLVWTGQPGEISAVWIYYKVLGRCVGVGLGTATIGLVYLIGRRLYRPMAAVMAALCYAAAIYPVQNAAFFTPAVPASCMVALTLYVGLRLRETPTPVWYLLAGIAVGLAAGTWYPAGIVAVAIWCLHIDTVRTQPRRWVWDRRLGLAALMATLIFLIACPGLLVHTSTVVARIYNEFFQAARVAPSGRLDPWSWLGLGLKHIEVLGPSYAVLVALGLLSLLRRGWRRALPWIVPVFLCWFLLVNLLRQRHLIILVPFYALWLGALVERAARWRWGRIVAVGLVILATGLTMVSHTRIFAMRYTDARGVAAHALVELIPAGASVGIKCLEGGTKAYTHAHFDEFLWDFPRIDPTRYQLTDCLAAPEYLIVSEYTNKEPLTGFASGVMPGDTWPAEEYGLWWRQKIPAPALLRLYRALLLGDGGAYERLRTFPGAELEHRDFQRYYMFTRFHRVAWRELAQRYLNPWTFMAFEYPSPEIQIFRRRTGRAQ